MSKVHVVLVTSGGGHMWQGRAICAGLSGATLTELVADGTDLVDCNARTPLRALRCLGQVGWHLCRLRPEVVISTGAMPGLLALVVARILRKRTVWIDSVANAERLSLSGRAARPFAQLWLTQWPDVAAQSGARFCGRVL